MEDEERKNKETSDPVFTHNVHTWSGLQKDEWTGSSMFILHSEKTKTLKAKLLFTHSTLNTHFT